MLAPVMAQEPVTEEAPATEETVATEPAVAEEVVVEESAPAPAVEEPKKEEKKEEKKKEEKKPLEFSYGGAMQGKSILDKTVEEDGGAAAYVSLRLRQYFTAQWEGVKTVFKFEFDPTFGKDDGSYAGTSIGADVKGTQKKSTTDVVEGITTDIYGNVTSVEIVSVLASSEFKAIFELKNAYMEIPAFNILKLKYGIFGWTSPSGLAVDNDLPGAQLSIKASPATINVAWIKAIEKSTKSIYDDNDWFSVGADIGVNDDIEIRGGVMVGGMIATDGTDDGLDLVVMPDIGFSGKFGVVGINFGFSGGFGKNTISDVSYAGIATGLDVNIDVKPVSVGVFFDLATGSGDDADTVTAYGSIAPGYSYGAFNYFNAQGCHGFGYGDDAVEADGVMQIGGSFGVKAGIVGIGIKAGYNLAMSSTGAAVTDAKAYGFEGDLNLSLKLAKNASLEYEFNFFAPGEYFGTDVAPQMAMVFGPKVKW